MRSAMSFTAAQIAAVDRQEAGTNAGMGQLRMGDPLFASPRLRSVPRMPTYGVGVSRLARPASPVGGLSVERTNSADGARLPWCPAPGDRL